MKLPRIQIGRPQRLAGLLAAVFLLAVPVGGEPAGAFAAGLSLRAVRARDVGAAVAAGGVLYDLRQSEWRWDLCVPGGGVAADGAAAGDAGAATSCASRRTGCMRGYAERIDVGGAARARQREVSDASAVYLVCDVAGRRVVVGLRGGCSAMKAAFFALGLYCFCPDGGAVCGDAEQRCAGDVGAVRAGVYGDGRGARDAGAAEEVEAADRAVDGGAGVDGGGASAGGDAGVCGGVGVDAVPGGAAAQLRDADPDLLGGGRAGDPVCVLCVSAGAVQLRVYRRRGAVLVLAGWRRRRSLASLANGPIVVATCGGAGAVRWGAAEPVLRQYGAAGDDCCCCCRW